MQPRIFFLRYETESKRLRYAVTVIYGQVEFFFAINLNIRENGRLIQLLYWIIARAIKLGD